MEKQKSNQNEKIKPNPILGDPPKLGDKIVIVKSGIMSSENNTLVPLENVTTESLHLVFANWQPLVGYPATPNKEGKFNELPSSEIIPQYVGKLEIDPDTPTGHAYNVDISFVYEGEERIIQNAAVEVRYD